MALCLTPAQHVAPWPTLRIQKQAPHIQLKAVGQLRALPAALRLARKLKGVEGAIHMVSRGAVGLGGGTPGGGGDTNAGGERREPGALGVREGGQAIVEGASAAARAQGGRRIPRALLGKVRWAAGRVLRGLGECTALVCAPGGC